MKTGQLFWGLLFITFGGLFLLNNFTPLKMNWDFVWNLWPIILIILGSYFLIRQTPYKWILVVLDAIILGVVLFAAIKSMTGFIENDDFDVNYSNTEHFRKEYSSNINSANLYLEAAAGRFDIKNTTDMLIDAEARGNFSDYYFDADSSDGNYQLSLEMKDQHHFRFGNSKNNVDIKLNPNPKWDLRFDVGASSVNLDLSPYNIQSLNIKSGAANIKVKLGARSDYTKVNVESGVSHLDIQVPSGTGCQINADADLSSKNFSGFEKIDKNTYQTNNFNSSGNKAVIDLKVAVSSINVSRY